MADSNETFIPGDNVEACQEFTTYRCEGVNTRGGVICSTFGCALEGLRAYQADRDQKVTEEVNALLAGLGLSTETVEEPRR